jgi:hypothetical protein
MTCLSFVCFLQWRFKAHRTRRARWRPAYLPRLETLRDRIVPSTFTVSNLVDSGAGSLRQAVLDANAHPGPDAIDFAPGLHGTIRLTSGELLITDSVTIDGPGANDLAVSGNSASRVFETATGIDVTISGLTVLHGYALDQGGGILNDGANLALTGDVLSQNVVRESAANRASGAALKSLDGALTITNCQIIGNQSLGAAGAAAFGDAAGAGIYVLAGTVTISDSTISGNLARGGDNSGDGNGFGAGIYTRAPVSIADSTISDNLALGGNNAPGNSGTGGGLYIYSSTTTTITRTTLSGNQAVGGNGGIGQFASDSSGGAIQNYGSLAISDSTFDSNRAVGGNNSNSGPNQPDPSVDEGQGGAIAAFFGTRTTVSNSTFSHNEAIGGHNGIATATDEAEVGVGEGGAICSEIGAAASFSSSTFDDNQAIGGNGNTGSGPVIHVGAALGAGIYSGIGGGEVGASPLTVSDSLVIDNSAQGGDHNTGTASVEGLVGVGTGGGIMNDLGSTASVSGSVLTNNLARGGSGNMAGGSGALLAGVGAGGGIFNDLGNYNSPPEDYGPLGPSVVTVSGSVIDLNLAQGGGGANGEGGGIANVLSATTTVGSSFLVQNQANGGSAGAGLGGGAYNDATSSLTLTKCLVTLNEAEGATGIGGGVYTLGTFTDPLSLIVGNHASTSDDNIGP